MTGPAPVTVVVACFDPGRWDATRAAITSVLAQRHPVVPIVVVDHSEELLTRLRRWAPDEVAVLSNTLRRGASGARNTAVATSRTDLVAFLDDDAVACPSWVGELVEAVDDPAVVGAGGAILPAWHAGAPPHWFPEEFGWTVGATDPAPADRRRFVRNVWSGNMLVRRDAFLRAGGFRDDFGIVRGSREPEDTELCLRMSAVSGGGRWCLLGGARIDHRVPAARETRAYFLRRCWAEGAGKAELSVVTGSARSALAAEQHYLTRTVPRALLARGRALGTAGPPALDQAAMIVAGVAAAGTGFAARRLRHAAAAGVGGAHDHHDPGAATAPARPAPAGGTHAAARTPARVVEVEIGAPLPRIDRADRHDGRRFPAAHVLVRLRTEPIGVVRTPVPAEGLAPERLAERIQGELGAAVAAREPAAGRLSAAGLPATDGSAFLDERAATLADAPPISVVVCTRDRGDRIAPCLAALERQVYPDFEVVVVDNAPRDDAVREALAAGVTSVPARRVVEPRPGVARARNRGWQVADGAVVAYVDDDEVADPHWLAEMARGLRCHPSAAGLTGAILPAAIDTEAQYWFEEFGGHGKGRGFDPVVFDPASHAVQHPLYPLPSFGASGNMAIRRDVLAATGGFDVALGPGTPALGSEDTALICDLMLAGHTLVYWPTAVVRHRHYDDWEGLTRQLYGYGLGLGAFYTRAILQDPRRLLVLSRLAPGAVREMWGRGRAAAPHGDYPAELDRLERRGLRRGPAGYLRSRHAARRDVPAATSVRPSPAREEEP